ncbi:MAG: hypothetical protein MUO67_05005, partial [Anaerolineales bacterium]|nr:hypothetical protein [Anaerolineales bacterium]
MHLSDQEIRTYFAAEESNLDAARIGVHLAECPKCQNRADQLTSSGALTGKQMSVLAPINEEGAQPVQQAYSRFEQRYLEKEGLSMFDRIFNGKYRFAWVAIGVVAFLAVAMLFPQMRAIGSSFLGLFRVEQFTIIQVDPEEIGEQLGSSSNFEYLLAEDVEMEELGEMQEAASAAKASDLAGFSVRLPAALPGDEQLIVQPGVRVSMLVDLPKVQALLNEIGVSDLVLPSELDGAEVSMELPVAVAASFGTCEVSSEMVREAGVDPDGPIPDLSECVTLTQFPSPEISAPPGLDIAKIGAGFLQVLGMSPEEAAQFSQSVDWTTTLVIPIPRYGTEYQEVFVDGVEGTLIMQS